MTNQYPSCQFCHKFSSTGKNITAREWYDHIVLQSDDFVAVPALGQIIPGYLLVIPRKHVLSMSQLNSMLRSKLEDFANLVTSIQKKYWDSPVIFEHGTCHESPAGSCIAHAHWHLVPGNWNLLPEGLVHERYDTFNDFVKKVGSSNPYLLFIDQSRKVYYLDGNNAPGQFFRRQLAHAIGKHNEWDYLAFPFYENIRETIKTIGDTSIDENVL